MITIKDYYMGRDVLNGEMHPELTAELERNANTTVDRANLLLTRFYADRPTAAKRKVSSGWRPAAVNARVPGAAKLSNHMTCKAIDLEDFDGELDDWCMENLPILEELELWLEHPSATKNWCHLQIVPPRSGRRVFYP